MTQIAAFLFDMDGLLLDTERVAMQTFVQTARPFGFDTSAAELFFLRLVGTSTKVTSERLRQHFDDEARAVVFEAEWRDAFTASLARGVPLKTHVREMLDMLSARRQRMAVVTSTYGDPARHHLEHAGILGFFEAVRGGDEVSANKPDPAPYVEMAGLLGVAPEDCAAFEDSDRGITAAMRAGCRAVQIPDLRPADVPFPDLGQKMARDLKEALAVLDFR